MATILYLTTGLGGMAIAGVELARRLRARGHDVVFASHRDCGAIVEDAGFELVQLVRAAAHREQFDTATTDAVRRDARTASLHDNEVEDLVAARRPDLLLVDVEMHVALVVTRPLAIPTVVVTPWCSMFPSWTNPPLHTPLEPGPRAVAAWLRLWAGRLRRELTVWLRRRARQVVPPPIDHSCRSRADLAELARTRGVRLRRHTTRLAWLQPHTWTGLDILSFTPSQLEFAPVRDPRVRHVGPMVPSDPPPGRGTDAWQQFLATRPAGRPLVYCTLGSLATDRRMLEQVVEVFRRRDDWDLVVGLGELVDEGSLGPVPDSVLLLPWAPQVEVLSRADAAIVHGGMGTICECIAQGVPMACYSHGGVDAEGNVARVVHHRLGVRGDRSADGPDQIEAAVQTLLDDASYRQRCARMQTAVARYRVGGTAERIVESALP